MLPVCSSRLVPFSIHQKARSWRPFQLDFPLSLSSPSSSPQSGYSGKPVTPLRLLFFLFLTPFASCHLSFAIMSSGNSSSSSGAGSQQGGFDPGVENKALSNYLYIICGTLSAAIILWRICDGTSKLVRTIACLNNDRQRYFAAPSPKVTFLKRHLLYAPIFRKRHNREIQLSSAINVGTLPTRFQLLFLTAYFATNVAFCVIEVPFAQSYEAAAQRLLGRTGILATVNLVRCLRRGTPLSSLSWAWAV